MPLVLEVTCKFSEPEVALPGLGFTTDTENVPAEGALPLAVSCAADTKVVASGEPANITCAPLTKLLPFTVMVKLPEGTDTGEMLVSTGAGFQSVTVPLPDAEAFAALTAVMVTTLGLGTLPGAVYTPEELIKPLAALPPVTPFTCQLTDAFDVPLTVALNVCAKPARTLAVPGETETVTPEGEVVPPEFDEPLVAPVHPASAAAERARRMESGRRTTNVLNCSSTKRRISGAPFVRLIVCMRVWLGAALGTTVRRDKNRIGTCEQAAALGVFNYGAPQ
jgi:hypothetical protein